MASNIAEEAAATAAEAMAALVEADGIARHPYLTGGIDFTSAQGMRDLADAIHYLCILHGRHPGLAEHAVDAAAAVACASRTRLVELASAFGAERSYVTRLAVAAGPVPSTPGSAECEAAAAGQCHALDMLARSERRGCATGAVIALVADWRVFRTVIDQAAARLSVPIPPCRLPEWREVVRLIDEAGDEPGVRRAMRFGASQVLVQHRGFLDLLDARRGARRAAGG